MVSDRPFEERLEGSLLARALTLADAEPPQDEGLSLLSVAPEERDGVTLIALSGELDVYTAASFWEHVRRYDPAEVQMVIDLGQVTLIDAAGLGALVSLRNSAHQGGARVGLICPQRPMERILWATGVRSAFVVGPDLAAVAAELARRRGS